MGRNFTMMRKTYAGRKHRDHVDKKRAQGIQNLAWQQFNSGKLSPEEQAREDERLKKEAKLKAGEDYRRQVEGFYDDDEEEEDTETVEVMFHIAKENDDNIVTVCVALRVMPIN